MTANVYLKYEEARDILSLLPENENDDRITILFCNKIVNSILENSGKDVENQDDKIMKKLVLNVFQKIREMESVKKDLHSGDEINLTDMEMMKLFDVVEETLEIV